LDKIKVGIVNYLNTRPLLYGIERSAVKDKIELDGDYPSNLARKLIDGEIDLGLVPVAVIPKLKEYHIVTDYCIGCNGPVASVCIFSDVPLQEARSVLMDYQSRTSVALAGLLLRDYWKLGVPLVDTKDDYRSRIKGTTAGLVIGDRALEQRNRSPYIYDLGEAWKAHTGLPFVFAAWISNKVLPEAFVEEFNEANGIGMKNIDEIADRENYHIFDLHDYYTKFISYRLDIAKRAGLESFISRLT
jgi:chorismate dehydratase